MAEQDLYNDNLSLDEIVFQNRNKAYGAYDLRKTYPRILTKAFVAGTLLFCAMAITPFVVSEIKKIMPKEEVNVKADLIDLTETPEEEEIIEEIEETPPPPPPKAEEPPQQEIIQNVIPEPKKEVKVETPPPPISVQKETTTGLINQEGEKKTTYVAPTPPPAPPSTGTKAATVEAKPPINKEVIHETVEQEAQFPGGSNAFRSKVMENFDGSSMDGGEGTLTTEVTFVVELDGSITQIKAKGSNSDFNREAERTIKSIKTKWTPAKIDGQPVRSRFKLPLKMNFE